MKNRSTSTSVNWTVHLFGLSLFSTYLTKAMGWYRIGGKGVMYQDTNKYSIGLPQGYKSFIIIGHWRIGILSNEKQSQKDYRYNLERMYKLIGVLHMKQQVRNMMLNNSGLIKK